MKTIDIQTSFVFERALETLDISIDAFAKFVNKDRATIYRYINGETKIPLEILISLLDLVYDHGVDIVQILGIENENQYLYHATSSEIIFPIDVHINDGKQNDFGNGFYLGENLRQSSTFGKLGYSTIIYRFKREKFKDLQVLDFNSLKTIDWLNYIAINRRKIAFQDYPSLFIKYQKLTKDKDIIKGKIADSFSYEILESLYENKLDIDQAEYCSKIMALGNQYCLKNEEFASILEADEMIRYDKTLSAYFRHLAVIISQKQNKNVETILKRVPNPDRVFSKYLGDKYE